MSNPAAATATTVATRTVVSRKQVLSLFGLVPLGAFVVLHLWTNLSSLAGPDAFDKALQASSSHPALPFLEIFGLGLPLLAHTFIGIRELSRARVNIGRYGYFDNLKFVLQRLSAIGVGLFIPAHIIKARILPMVSPGQYTMNGHETWAGMHAAFQEPLTVAVYALGLLGISYHLANGLYTAGIRWGLAISPAGRARLQTISAMCFVVLLAMGFAALWGFRPLQEA